MNKSVQAKLQELQKNYAKQLPQKIQDLVAQWQKIKVSFDKQSLKDFNVTIHKLCGTAGTYGYPLVSKIARDLEIYINQLLDYRALNATHYSEISHLMSKMEDTIKTNDVSLPSENLARKVVHSNMIPYLTKEPEHFLKELAEGIQNFDYNLQLLDTSEAFETLIQQYTPVVALIDDNYLTEQNIKLFAKIHSRYQTMFICLAQKEDIATRLKSVRAGMSIFLLKPVLMNKLINKIYQLCGLSIQNDYRILILDDSVDLANYYALILKEAGMVVQILHDPMQLFQNLQEFKPNLVLLDLYLPECSGFDLAVMIRQEEAYMGLPIIFISTEDDRIKQLTIINSVGADDFLTKPVLPQNLISAVKSRAQRSALLNFNITHDPLTNLLTHASILQQLSFEILRARRQKQMIAVAMIDLDHFKKINDEYGHPTGDVVLMKIAEMLVGRQRKTDFVGRYGGEEFTIIFTDTSMRKAKKLCEDFRKKISTYQFDVNGHVFSVTLSIGMAEYPSFQTARELVTAADRALYQAKSKGRNRVELAC